ncbi:PREDICTED: rhodopsin, GQ-coupled-like [Amphimedon queenslandica]|uniref:G-protein coupled receptors family 1 profile domain-containing protein n=1 Tax=Amphimedon queenslandica TaxID=400682 RepID=A0A1X7VU29_AMPQE|nr:PREDICTED: rhodopsin, GQ-coupled-like [Amphimedon queenslandica]|eukprot:XP_011409774.1 PREDICTED: rhodopsin, GQ-coupled-like [Amphimedon queenslandica]
MSFNSTDFVLTGDINSPTYAAVLGIEGVIGIIANVAVLLMTLYQRKSWNQPSTIFFTSLLLPNLIIALCYLMSSIAVGAEEWIFGNTFEQKNGSCMFVGYILWNGIMIIAATLAAISFDRFLFIVKPHLHKQFMRPRVALILIIGVWLLSSLINTIPFYSTGGYGYFPPNGICSFLNETSPYYFVVLILVYAISYSIMAFTSIWTFFFTRSFIKRQGRSVDSGVYQSKNKKLFGIFGSMLLSYILSFFPSYIVGFFVYFGLPDPDGLYAFTFCTYGLVVIINPLIQSYFRPEIKEVLASFANKIGLKSNKILPVRIQVEPKPD